MNLEIELAKRISHLATKALSRGRDSERIAIAKYHAYERRTELRLPPVGLWVSF
jgi:hypothetical protein